MHLKIPPAIVFLVSSLLLWGISTITIDYQLNIPFSKLIAYVIFVIGGLVGLSGIIEFRRHKTTVDPTKPEKASNMVTTGIYRFTRNPMYLGMAIWLLGASIYKGNPLALFSIVIFISYLTEYQIKPEEKALKKRFGKAYISYLEIVRRWI